MKFRGSTRRPREAAGPGYRHCPPLGPSCLYLGPSLLAAHSELLSPWRWGGGRWPMSDGQKENSSPRGICINGLGEAGPGGGSHIPTLWGWRRGLWDESLWANPRRSLKQCCGNSPAVSGMLAWNLHTQENFQKRDFWKQTELDVLQCSSSSKVLVVRVH